MSPWVFFLVRCLFPGGGLGPVSCGLLFASAGSGLSLVCPVFFGLCAFLCCVFVVLRVSCWLLVVAVVSSSVALFVFAFVCVGLLRLGSLSPGFARALTCPPPWLVLWCLLVQSFSAGPSLRVSGCICDGPVVMPVVWCVVTAWLLSSLLLMATKASALCGALPSTPCCGCCLGASLSCTEVFALG